MNALRRQCADADVPVENATARAVWESGNEELRARLDRQQVEIDAFRAAFAALDDADKLRVLNVARRELTP